MPPDPQSLPLDDSGGGAGGKGHLRTIPGGEPEPDRYALVDLKTGQQIATYPEPPDVQAWEDKLRAMNTEKAGWQTRYFNLKRDKEAEAQGDTHWPAAKRVHDYWRSTCGHLRSGFTFVEFELVLPFLERDGEDLCRRAIDGAAHDPFTTRRRNGSLKRHDGFELIFRNRAKFEEFVNRAPRKAS